MSMITNPTSQNPTRRLPIERALEVIFAIASLAALAFLLRPLFLETARQPEPEPPAVTARPGGIEVSANGKLVRHVA